MRHRDLPFHSIQSIVHGSTHSNQTNGPQTNHGFISISIYKVLKAKVKAKLRKRGMPCERANEAAREWTSKEARGKGERDNAKGATGACERSQRPLVGFFLPCLCPVGLTNSSQEGVMRDVHL